MFYKYCYRCERTLRMSVDKAEFLLDQKTKRCKYVQVRQISITIQIRNSESQPFINIYYKIYL